MGVLMYEGPLAMTQKSPIRVFHSLYKVGINGIIGIQGFNSCKKILPPMGIDLMQENITGLRAQLPNQ